MTKDHDSTALPSWRGLLFGAIALVGAALLAALVISGRVERSDRPSSASLAASPAPEALPAPPLEPPPALLEPPAAWKSAAAVLDDARATSALLRAVDGEWPDVDRHLRAMAQVPARGNSDGARASNAAGLGHFRTGDYTNAIKAFDSASRADPGDVEVANNLGYAYLKAGRMREAVPQLLRTLHLAPARSSAWINLSEALAAMGHDDASFAGLLIALRYSTRREETREFLRDAALNHASEAFRKQASRALESSKLER